MRLRPRPPQWLLACALWVALNLTGTATAATAEPASNTPLPAWADRGVPVHVDRQQFTGRLNTTELNRLVDAGERLFTARFTREDGVGRPMATQAIIPTRTRRPARSTFSRTAGLDANACASCHQVPRVGGAGDFSANVFVSEGFVHADFDTTDPQFSNERNTNHLFGAGLVELLAREMSADLQAQRRQALQSARRSGKRRVQALSSKGVAFGSLRVYPDGVVDTAAVEGVDSDLIIRPFSHKGVITSLRQFTVNALNHHHGMQADERFGPRWTSSRDFDGDGVGVEITDGDVSALVAWQATLPPPVVREGLPADWQRAAKRGARHFDELGCEGCHRPSLPLNSLLFDDPGPLDAAGTLRTADVGPAGLARYDLALRDWAARLPRDAQGQVLVPLFGDLKRHTIADRHISTLGNEQLSQRFVERDVFMTTELWGVGSTAPYGHRGDLGTLAEVIAAHGGDARRSRDAYQALDADSRSDIDAFLKTLIIEP